MICYRDMAFCTFYADCRHKDTCHRPLTETVKQAAAKWWGGEDAPISVFWDKPACWETP